MDWNQLAKKAEKIGKDRFVLLLIAGIICVLLSNGLVNIIHMPSHDESTFEREDKTLNQNLQKEYDWNRNKDDDKKQSNNHDKNQGKDYDMDQNGDKEHDFYNGTMTDYERYYADELESFLSQLYGAGRVKVLVYMKNSKELVLAKNCPYSRKTQEEKAEGETKSVLELENDENVVLYENVDGNQVPLILKEVAPQIGGIVVLAQGGDKKSVADNISCLLQALFGIDEHKIRVAKLRE